MKYRVAIVLFGILTFASCWASPATRYYTLDAIEPTVVPSNALKGLPVVIDKVVLPATLDRPQIVRRISANRIDIDESDRWPAPLDKLVQQVLTQDLAKRMPAEMVIQPGEALPTGATRHIIVDIETFEGDLTGQVVLRAQWTVQANPPAMPIPARDEFIAVNSGSGSAEAIVAGMSEALSGLADRMASALNRPPESAKTKEASPLTSGALMESHQKSEPMPPK